MKLWEKEKEKAYHEDVMRHVAEGDRREAAELEARKLKNAVICKQQQAQLAEFRENYLERLRIVVLISASPRKGCHQTAKLRC